MDINCSLSGVGNIRAYDFVVQNATCYLSGIGDIKVQVMKTLNGKVNGRGKILYKGGRKSQVEKVLNDLKTNFVL